MTFYEELQKKFNQKRQELNSYDKPQIKLDPLMVEYLRKTDHFAPFFPDMYIPAKQLDNVSSTKIRWGQEKLDELSESGKFVLVSLYLDDFCNLDYLKALLTNFNIKKGVIFEVTTPVITFKQIDGKDVYLPDHKDSTIFGGYNLEKIFKSYKFLKDNGYNLIIFENGMTFDKLLEANLKLDEWANEINAIRINGESLSPLEKYIYAYKQVTKLIYKENYDIKTASRETAQIIDANGSHIVCLGFANLLSTLCNKMGIPCLYNRLKDNKINGFAHANSMVYIKDEKYGIDGVYLADPCYDAPVESRLEEEGYLISTSFMLMDLKDAEDVYARENYSLDDVSDSFFHLASLPIEILVDERDHLDNETIDRLLNMDLDFINYSSKCYNSFDPTKLKTAVLKVTKLMNPDFSDDEIEQLVDYEYNVRLPESQSKE